MRHSTTVVVVLVLLAATASGCDRPIEVQPQAVEDAQVGVRVKTAIVNDAQLGPRVIEVRVTRGLVILSGLVASAEEAARAVAIARSVTGVTDVRSQLVVREKPELPATLEADEARDPPARLDDEIVSAGQRRLLAVGASVNTRHPSNDSLASTVTAGPLLRLGAGRGLGLALGFSWFQTDLSSNSSPDPLGRITIRPVMGGLSYTLTDQTRVALSLSMVGGMAFNSFTLRGATVRDVLALETSNSVAVRPGVSVWFDLNSRAAVNVFSGYVITRPEVTFLEHGQFATRSVRADTAVLNVGLAYKVF
jgi:hyperosmotically inducible protein